jgi:hypothetical protein
MPLRRTTFGTVVATGLILGLSGCGGHDQAAPSANDTPLLPVSTPIPTPTPTPTVDPTAAAKAKVLADYRHFTSVSGQGWLSNKPSYPYEQVMTGEALSAQKAVVTGADLIGTKYSGSLKFIKGSVVALDLKAKPATATVRACVHDALVAKTKAGKTVSPPPAYVSREDRMVLVAGRWKATDTKATEEDPDECLS